MQDFYKIFYILQEKHHFSARLARYVQDLAQDLASLAKKYLQDLHIFARQFLLGSAHIFWPKFEIKLIITFKVLMICYRIAQNFDGGKV